MSSLVRYSNKPISERCSLCICHFIHRLSRPITGRLMFARRSAGAHDLSIRPKSNYLADRLVHALVFSCLFDLAASWSRSALAHSPNCQPHYSLPFTRLFRLLLLLFFRRVHALTNRHCPFCSTCSHLVQSWWSPSQQSSLHRPPSTCSKCLNYSFALSLSLSFTWRRPHFA
jgi:hypothetical protein